MQALKLTIDVEKLRLAAPFRIAGHVFESVEVIVVTLDDGAHRGRGEASGVYYLRDDAPAMVSQIEACRDAIEAGIDRTRLQRLLAPGGARNALDCALWELQAFRAGAPVWQLAGVARPKPLVTTFTLSAEAPAVMAEGARRHAQAQSLKVKLTGNLPLDTERIRAVRAARPGVWLGVDANQAYDIRQLDALIAELLDAGVALLEQPVARGREIDLRGFASPIPIAADESALSRADLPGLIGCFDIVNIKLDKCGGLTEGLAIARAARELGLGVMVGNMVGSSLAMAPAFVLGQLCDVVDLDGPTFLANDRTPAVTYANGTIWCGEDVWGGPEQSRA